MTPPKPDRRKFNRSKGRGTALVIRDSDMMRHGIKGELEDISHAGLSIILPAPLEIGENVCIQLENPIQRTSVSARGCVKWVNSVENGFRIGCAFNNWLVPPDVLALKKM